MKKILAAVLIIVCILALPACRQDNTLHLGINAEIVEIDTDHQLIYITDCGEENIFGDRCAIDCQKLIENNAIIYVDNNTGDALKIPFSDLSVGDIITINAYENQLSGVVSGIIEAEQIQLTTQRLTVN